MNPLHHPGLPKAPCGSPGTPFPKAPGGSPGIRPKWDRLQPVMPSRPAFTLTELLIVVAIILGLMTLLGSAVSAARTGAKVSSTRATIEKLNTILATQLATYDSRPVDVSGCPSGTSRNAYRAWFIRRNMITGDMPDRWSDVQYMANNPAQFTSPAQKTYISIWNSLTPPQQNIQTGVNQNNGSAECLFMIVMRAGIADCLDCGALRTSDIGDEDLDGMPEFWDAWGSPISYLLWAPAVELPAGSGLSFFSGLRVLDAQPFALSGSIRPSLGMKPLIYSPGPDGRSGIERHSTLNGASKIDISHLSFGSSPLAGWNCGNHTITTPIDSNSSAFSSAGGKDTQPVPSTDTTDYRADNITNLDAEAKQ
jgi:prepilin-type N-terminal cleavage/methylation domain-containing protein